MIHGITKRGGSLTQARLAELLQSQNELIIVAPQQISMWETGDRKISADKRDLLIAIIQVLQSGNGIDSLKDANALLRSGGFSGLGDDEIALVNSGWLPSDEPPQFIERKNTSIPSGFQPQQSDPPFLTPALPPQGIFGRNKLIKTITEELRLADPEAVDIPPLALRGMAGIGKTTLATAIGRLQPIQAHFPDGILWTSVGQTPTIRLLLDSWGRALGIDLNVERDEKACQERLRAVLHNRRTLLIVDDVWEKAHGNYFQLAGPHCRLLFTTRESEIAFHLATRERSLRVDLLEPEFALGLLQKLAPDAVFQSTSYAKELCERLEYLPLGITLAGRLLADEEIPSRTERLLKQLVEREGALDLIEPTGRAGTNDDKPISVRGILALSVDRLEQVEKERFAMAGVFGGDPLTWELEAAAHVWECSIEQAEDTTSLLMRRGLVEMRGSRFWMHALLADYAEELMEKLGL